MTGQLADDVARFRCGRIGGKARGRHGVRPLDRFNLNLFFALDAILNNDTLTEAARKTHLTQPAMSVSLKKLRGVFGDELVVYQGGGTTLTALGLAIRPRVTQILQASREVFDLTPVFDPATAEATIRIAAPDVVELSILGPLLARIGTDAPLMAVESLPFTYQSVDALFRRPLDLAIVAEPFSSPAFAREHLFSETMSCIVWRDGRYGEAMTEADYLSGRHLSISHSQAQLAHPVGIALRALSEGQQIVARASSYAALPHALVGSDLIATTLTTYARQCATMLPVTVHPVPVVTPTIDFVAQWQEYRSNEPIIGWLLETVRSVVRGSIGC